MLNTRERQTPYRISVSEGQPTFQVFAGNEESMEVVTKILDNELLIWEMLLAWQLTANNLLSENEKGALIVAGTTELNMICSLNPHTGEPDVRPEGVNTLLYYSQDADTNQTENTRYRAASIIYDTWSNWQDYLPPFRETLKGRLVINKEHFSHIRQTKEDRARPRHRRNFWYGPGKAALRKKQQGSYRI